MKILTSTLVLAAWVLSAGQPAVADDAVARALLQEANGMWWERATRGSLDTIITKLESAETEAVDTLLKYDIVTKLSLAYYFDGVHFAPNDDERMKRHQKGMDKAKAAKALSDDYAEAYYYYAINLGRWALAKGVLASLQRKGELMDNAEGAIARINRDGTDGETIDGWGPHRTIGRMFYKLPGFAGGSREKALKSLELATTNGPKHAINYQYLAEALHDGSSADKARAKQMLDDLLTNDPLTFNPDRVPESVTEFADCRKLRRDMGN